MSILVDRRTRVAVQGITGREGAFHARQMVEYGTRVVAGVAPGKGGGDLDGIPIFDTLRTAVHATGADASAVFVPPRCAADAIMEAVDAELTIVVCLTEGIPTLDMIAVNHYMADRETRLIGPNTPGIISPGQCKIGVMAGYIHREGRIGIVSRSGTLTYEAVDQISKLGLGQSTCVGIGGDPVGGLSFTDILERFEKDEQTEAVVMIGEIGGQAEEEAAGYFRTHMKKPVVAFIAGVSAPSGRRMGHAGAIISGSTGGAADKIRVLEEAGIVVAKSPADIGDTIARALGKR